MVRLHSDMVGEIVVRLKCQFVNCLIAVQAVRNYDSVWETKLNPDRKELRFKPSGIILSENNVVDIFFLFPWVMKLKKRPIKSQEMA